MSRPVLLCYITDRTQFPGDETSRRRRLLDKIAEAARWGIDYIQLREKDLSTRDLEQLAAQALNGIREQTLATRNSVLGTRNWSAETRNPILETRLLINSRTDIALAADADGAHLRADDVSPTIAHRVASLARGRNARHEAQEFVIGISCHSPAEVAQAAAEGADFALFAPIFEKRDLPEARPAGLGALRQACQHRIPVLALGGVTMENARACFEAGAAGIAAIRLFQENDIRRVVATLRGL